VVLTFDDGYRDYYEHAYPALKALGIPAINFLATDYVDRPRLTWWERLFLAVRSTRERVVQAPWDHGRVFDLNNRGRAAFLRACKTYLKSVPDAEIEGTLRRIWEVLDVDPDSGVVPRQTMSWHEVRAARDVTTYGGHTHKHPLLTKVDRTRAEWEIATCRRRLTEELGAAPRFFAYPVGDFDDSVKEIVKRGGFDVAFSTVAGINGSDADWLAVKRVSAEAPIPEVAWAVLRLSGFAGWIRWKRA
jgi:peptidoglycan/xylan/chitin deacetylase (PgdA/CDA1 family)